MAAIIDKLKSKSQIKQGDKITSTHGLKEDNPEKATVHIANLAGKNILVGVPGAFTPPCSSQVPGYVEHAESFASKGVKGIYIVAVNDQFTVAAWKQKLGANKPLVHFVADDTGNFTKDIGLSFDATGLLGNHRSQRYAAVINNGVVEKIFVEDQAPDVTVTKAESVLQAV